ncbi:hypothetical protein [Streptomyces sp. N35]|uniref:hypothetical protein n=1 Tax=Streptomyces sp. N35 TaxID=2795730 RepID=UPI0018F677D6|nr:hypothetical protein [Streptomyces sp. N35]
MTSIPEHQMGGDQSLLPITALRSLVTPDQGHTRIALDHAAATGALLVGLANGDQPITLHAGDGHVLVAGATGAGKSSVLCSLAAQALAHGARVDVLTLRREHRWTNGLAQARRFDDVEAIHDYLNEARDLVLTDTPAHTPHQCGGAGTWAGRRLLVIDEADHTLAALEQFWQHTHPSLSSQESPAIEALAALLFLGRAHGIHILLSTQSGRLQGLRGSLRDQFGLCVVGYAPPIVWQRLAPHIHPAPRSSTTRGRVHAVRPGQPAQAVQALYVTDVQARALARGQATENLSRLPATAARTTAKDAS